MGNGSWHCRPGQDARTPPSPKLGVLGFTEGEAASLPVSTLQEAVQALPEVAIPQPLPRAHGPGTWKIGGGVHWGGGSGGAAYQV